MTVVQKVGPGSKDRRPGESIAEYLARVLTPRERKQVLAGLEAAAAKKRYGPSGIGSVAIKHILHKREAAYNAENVSRKRRRVERRRGLHGEHLNNGHRRNVGRDANGLPVYEDE